MRYVTLLLCVLAATPIGGWCQSLTGSVGGTLSGGWRTNTYLDPELRTWYVPAKPAFFDVRPTIGLAWNGSHTRAGLSAAGLSGIGGRQPPRLWSATGHGSYRVARSWTTGVMAGVRNVDISGSRTSTWILPVARWHPGGGLTVDLQPGWTALSVTNTSGGTAQYRSTMGLLRASYWPNDRWRLRAAGYLNDSEQIAHRTGFSRTGARLGARYWPTARLSIGIEAAVGNTTYLVTHGETTLARTSESSQLLSEVGADLQWKLARPVEIFSHLHLLAFNLQETSSTPAFDTQIRAGIHVRLSRTLWKDSGPEESSGPWSQTAAGQTFRVEYRGEGHLYLTGSFNNWADPGRRLTKEDDHTYTVTVSLPPGRYEYAIRITGTQRKSWLTLPKGTPTVPDGFGGENGLLFVAAR